MMSILGIASCSDWSPLFREFKHLMINDVVAAAVYAVQNPLCSFLLGCTLGIGLRQQVLVLCLLYWLQSNSLNTYASALCMV